MKRRAGMADSLAGVVLAAGAGERLRPLTRLLPKALCPVGNVALVDLALGRVRPVVEAAAVNVHHGRAAMQRHLEGSGLFVSIEEERARGTAGALGVLRAWLDGRGALVVNADAWSTSDLRSFVAAWDRRRPRVLVAGDDAFGPRSAVVASLLPWSTIAPLTPEPSGLYETVWAPHAEAGTLDVAHDAARFVDCGTPATYLRANLLAAADQGGSIVAAGADVGSGLITASVVGAAASIEGTIERCVVWSGEHVRPGEVLRGAIRAGGLTVLVR